MYKKMQLSYSLDGLEPYISKETMEVHYNTLYTRYLNNLNEVLKKNNFNFSIPKEDIYNIIKRFPIEDRETILFNLGGVLNHELYFDTMTEVVKENKDFENILVNKYISIDNFISKFSDKAKELKGSGYTFLVIDNDKELAIVNLSNQDSPYRYGVIPIMNLDLWEHAYFLDYKADKAEYIKNFFKLVDFDKVNKRYEEFSKDIC